MINVRFIVKWLMMVMLLGAFQTSGATEKGLFWQLESPTGKISYLYGTMHTDDNRVTDFSDAVLDAIKQVDTFVMETKPGGNLAEYYMQDGSLKTMLTEQELDQVKALTEFHVMHYDHALKMKPWLLAIVFSQSKPQTPFAQDNLLMRAAEDFGKAVQGLETNQEHFSVIDSFSLDEQLVLLRAALALTEDKKEADFEALLAIYLTEDSDQILAFDEKVTGHSLPKALWEKMRTKLLVERNDLMVNRAIEMTNEQSVFIAVGAAHLAGESGLINQLKKVGYKLTRLEKQPD